MIEGEDSARAYAGKFGDEAAQLKLQQLADLLVRENDHQNLIAKQTVPHVWQRHIADSAQLLAHVPRETVNVVPWLDLGSGAGFPGLVVAILRPAFDIHLIESRRIRIEWLNSACQRLKLANCKVIGRRLEQIDSFVAGTISARAFAPMERLIALSARFSRERTQWLLPKGRSALQELERLPESARELFHVEQSVTDPQAGIIVGHLRQQNRQYPAK